MKLNFQKIAELENTYRNNVIALNSLQTMIDQILHHNILDMTNSAQIAIAIQTLKELGVLVEEPLKYPSSEATLLKS